MSIKPFQFYLYKDSINPEIAIVNGTIESEDKPTSAQIYKELKKCGQRFLEKSQIDTSSYEVTFNIKDLAQYSASTIQMIIQDSNIKTIEIKIVKAENPVRWAFSDPLFNSCYD